MGNQIKNLDVVKYDMVKVKVRIYNFYHFNFVVWRDVGNVVPPGGHLGVAGVTERCVLKF